MSPTSNTHTPCGCGGGERGGSCSCGQAECGGCETQNLVRPRFFAGQLLTEDDLELLTSYVTAKGRLHNRHLHGAGVVCGLEVTCHPCGGGKVVVHPGHALDCCGNDILVPCAKELDVLDMIRRLRIDQLGGHDCGDPCAEAGHGGSAGGVLDRDPRNPNVPFPEAGTPDRAARRYCLYVRYCEELTDPVAPYATGEPCGERPCEPTRVREGFRFELRCPGDDPAPESLVDRLKCCFGDLKEVRKHLAGATVRDGWYGRNLAAASYATAAVPARFEEGDLVTLEQATHELSAYLPGDEEPPSLNGAELLKALDLHRFVGQGVTRAYLAEADGGDPPPVPVTRGKAAEESSDKDRVAGDRVAGDRFTRVGFAAEVWSQVAPLVAASIPNLSQAYTRELAQASLRQQEAWVVGQPPVEARLSFLGRYAAWGGVASPELDAFDNAELAELRQWLLNQLEGSKKSTDCRLRREVLAIRLDADPATGLSTAGSRLLAAFKRYLIDCLCRALLPPCPPCDDPAVLLACLTVEDCEVVDVCNLERTFVLSGPAIRYWLPQLRSLGEKLEQACCEPPKPDPLPDPSTPPGYFSAQPFATAATTYELAERAPVNAALDFSRVPAETSAAIAQVTAGYDQLLLHRDFAALPGLAMSRGFDNAAVLDAFKDRRLQEMMAEELQDEIGAAAAAEAELAAESVRKEVEKVAVTAETAARVAEERIAEVRAEAGTATTEVREKVDLAVTSVAKVERAMKSRLTATSLRDTAVVKDLKKTNSTLRESLRSLEKSNRELAQRLERLEKPEEAR